MEGNVLVLGDHIDTDVIIPARYLTQSDEAFLAKYCFADLHPDFSEKVKPGDMLVAGVNFGCGSSREHAPLAIKAAGVSCVIASSFARIFYRNSFNIGLPILESPEAAAAVRSGDRLSVDFEAGEIRNLTRNETYHAEPIPKFMLELVEAGGLVNYIREKKLGKDREGTAAR